MRNLKKVLSLALALVMLLGMMVVGAGAATSFKDDDKIQNQEAVAVLVGMGIMKGREDNSGITFQPDATLTRAEAAMMIAQMDLGVEAAGALKANGTNTFSDVWTDYWAAGAIDYCVEQGYINGDGAGHFLPNQNVTGVQFASMLLRLLGYDAKIEKLVGDQWAANAAALARKAGLTTKVMANNDDMTRDGMAQMAFNALTAAMVEYEGLDITIGDVAINARAKVRTHTGSSITNNRTYDGEPIKSNITPIRLCEERFPDLRLKRDSLDEFGREYSQWTWKYVGIAGSESRVGADVVYTKATAASAIKSDINDAKGYNGTEVYINGKLTEDASYMNSSRIAKLTKNGREVSVYLYDDDHTAIKKVVVVDTYAAKVNTISKDGTDDRYVTIVTQDNNQKYPETPTVALDKDEKVVNEELAKLDKTFKTSDFAAGDVVSYKAAWNADNRAYEIQEMNKLEIAATATLEKWVGSGLITSSVKGESDSNFTAGGQKYNYSVNNAIVSEYGEYTENRIASFTAGTSEINIYLDEYDFVIYVSGVEAVKNYATVVGVGKTNQYGSETRGVTLLMPDGTTQEVIAKMDKEVWDKFSSKDTAGTGALTNGFDKDTETENLYKDGIGDVVAYTVNDKDVYTLTISSNPANYYKTYTDLAGAKVTFTNGKSQIKITDRANNDTLLYTTSKTIFMIGSPSGSSYSYSSYIGYADAPTIDPSKSDKTVYGVSYVTNPYYKNQVDAIYIDVRGVVAPTNYVYFVKAAREDVTTTNIGTYTLPAVVDGEVTTIEIQTALSKAWVDGEAATSLENAPADLYVIDEITKNSSGVITGCKVITKKTAFNFTNGEMEGTIQRNGVVLGFGHVDEASAKYGAYTDNTNVFRIDEDWTEIVKRDVNSVPTDVNDKAWAQATVGTETKLTNVFVKDVEGNTTDNNNQDDTKPVGTDKLTYGRVALIVDKAVKAKNFAAGVSAGNLSYGFDTNMGAVDGTTYAYDWELKNAGGIVIAKGQETTAASSSNRLNTKTISDAMIVTSEDYTLTITKMVPASFKLTKDSKANGIAAADITVTAKDAAAASDTAGQIDTDVVSGTAKRTLSLTIPTAKIAANDKINVSFTVSGIDFDTVKNGTYVTGSNGSYTLSGVAPSALNGGYDILKDVVPTGEVKVTVTSVTDVSAAVKYTVKVTGTGKDYVDTATVTDLNAATGTVAVGATEVDLSALTAPKLAGSTPIVTAATYTIKATGAPATTAADVQANGGTGKLPNNVKIGAAKLGTPIVIEIEITPTEYTVPAANFKVVDVDSANAATAANVVFDKDGKIKAGKLLGGIADDGASYEVELGGTKKVLAESGSASQEVHAAAGDFIVSTSDLLNSASNKIEITVRKAFTITGAGVAAGTYVVAGQSYKLPSDSTTTNWGGTGLKVTPTGGSATYAKYGETINPTANVTLEAGYVKVTVTGSVGTNAAFSVTPNGITAVTSATTTLVKVGDTIAVASTATHPDNFKVTVTDGDGHTLLAETTLNGNGGGDRTATTAAAQDSDITVTLATP